jgi:pimeloyl-ACP methyl ester carboxylesterase
MGKCLSILKKFCLGLVALLLLLVCAGALYQFISTKLDEKRYPPPGKLVDIGGYKLHIYCMGSGAPTVILEAGMGSNSIDWGLVQPEIAKFTRICSYDRAGSGWSDASPLERTSQNIADELHTLLKNANIPGPYILVGHSFGGLDIRLYASKYPNEVVGMVLVESAHEDQMEKMPPRPESNFQKLLVNPNIAPFLASIGVFRILNHMPQSRTAVQMYPADIQDKFLAEASTVKNIRSQTQEYANIKISLNQVKKDGGFLGDIPLIVITGGEKGTPQETGQSQEFLNQQAAIWNQLQKDLVTKSTNGKQIFAEHSAHGVPRLQPEIITQAVQELVTEIRKNSHAK